MGCRCPALLALALAACAPSLPPPQAPTPAELTALEQRAAREQTAQAQVALGVALRAAGRRDSARAVLARVVAAHPRDAAGVLYLGITSEELGDYARADSLYRSYLTLGRSATLKREVQSRLALLQRKQLAAAIQRALASERELSAAAPEPRTVAVFPFAYRGQDPRLQPLSRALSALLTTDLAQTSRLRVLERTEIQALLSEAKLSGSGLVDSTTAVRSGRLLRAGRIVQGQVAGGEQALQIMAAVTGVGGAANGRRQPLSVRDPLSRLFDMEKTLALRLYSSMGIELTVAERERVSHRATQNLQALLEFGWGLQAEDAGDNAAAAEHFRNAARIDPGFTAAADRARDDQALADASLITTSQLAQQGQAEIISPAVPSPPLLGPGLRPQAISTLGLDGVRVLLPDPILRNPGSEVLGLDGVNAPATLVIVVRKP